MADIQKTTRRHVLDQIAQWLHDRESFESAVYIGIKTPSVTLDDFRAFQRLFGGAKATAERHASGGWTEWKITQDGIRFHCTEYHPGQMKDDEHQVAVPSLAGDVPQSV